MALLEFLRELFILLNLLVELLLQLVELLSGLVRARFIWPAAIERPLPVIRSLRLRVLPRTINIQNFEHSLEPVVQVRNSW